MLRKLLLWGGLLSALALLLLWLYPHSLFYAFVLLLLTAPRTNDAPANQLTLVQGTVTSAKGGRPLAGVLMAIESYAPYQAPYHYSPTGDSVRTDAQGHYSLRFYNRPGHYYIVSLEPDIPDPIEGTSTPSRYRFLTNNGPSDTELNPHERALTLGQANRWNFQPDEPSVVAVRLRHHHANYQQIEWAVGRETGFLPVSTRDTTIYLNVYDRPVTGGRFRYCRYTAAGDWVSDTVVSLIVHNPTAQPLDTVWATVRLARRE